LSGEVAVMTISRSASYTKCRLTQQILVKQMLFSDWEQGTVSSSRKRCKLEKESRAPG